MEEELLSCSIIDCAYIIRTVLMSYCVPRQFRRFRHHNIFVTFWSNEIWFYLYGHTTVSSHSIFSFEVFYLRGSHDHDIDAKAVETLFGSKVEFIDGTLIYVITDTSQEYRIRFTHGHDWDVFNTYSATDKEDLLYSKPFGYYVTRALESTRSCYCDTQQVSRHPYIVTWPSIRITFKFLPTTNKNVATAMTAK